ncbi:MAG TPA: transglycosylase domain-containing protein [Thermoleophilaceae bacterium]|nr:transglycosylase domain-containing protein [Thermoleophilaceae bacterium]
MTRPQRGRPSEPQVADGEGQRTGGRGRGGQPPGSGPPSGGRHGRPGNARRATRLRWVRVGLVLAGLAGLAMISTVFGMMMAVASELPSLDNHAEFRAAQNSSLFAGKRQVAKLTGNKNRILRGEGEVSPMMENAVIAIEDRRFFEHEGIDARGIARALWADVRRGEAVQGASTISQQFVKNALVAQDERTIFQKLREAALAYHLERQWSKRKILTQYLNTVYFGNGAYGIESAVRTYFGKSRGGVAREERAAADVEPHEAALLAGMIASPYAYDPIQDPQAARDRRNVVLESMLEQDMITRAEYRESIDEAVPAEDDIDPPKPDSEVPYFSTWVTQQLVERYGAGKVFGGGLKVQTTIDAELQRRAQESVTSRLPDGGPTASLVAIENKTGAVKAMVGGDNFVEEPFNVATNGRRQPGSAFKPFTLVTALEQGISADRTYTSRKKFLDTGDGGKFEVNNYEDKYAGVASLRAATAESDNSVFAELGLEVGTKDIARTAKAMGIDSPLSTNAAMTLGGLEQGVTPLELAYAYSTIANRGKRRSGTLATEDMGPVAIESVEGGRTNDRNHRRERRVFSRETGEQARELMRGVITSGTGTAADPGNGEFVAGKTGTTENYGDAWFVGFNDRYTIAVWVGYPDRIRPMKTEFNGEPVAGGTYPAEIWRDFMRAVGELEQKRNPNKPVGPETPGTPGLRTQSTGVEASSGTESSTGARTGYGGAQTSDYAGSESETSQTSEGAGTGSTGAQGASNGY